MFVLPLSPAEVTLEWLQAAVLDKRYPGTKISRLSCDRVFGGSATKLFLELEFAPAGNPFNLPQSMVLKGAFEKHDLAAGAQIPEVRFFNDVAGLLPPSVAERLPRCFYADADKATRQGLILMEDLTLKGMRFGDAERPETVSSVRLGLELLADLHAAWWDAEPLRKIKWLGGGGILSRGHLLDFMLSPEHWEACMALPRAATFSGPLRDRRTFRAAVKRMYELDAQGVHCLQHGDPHLGNWYFEKGGDPGLLDWQTAMAGPWVHDVTYFLIGSLTVADRRAHERALIEHYLEMLSNNGVASPPSFDEAWLHYRRHVMHGLMWVLNPPQMQPEPVSVASAERFIAAAEDLDTLGALDIEPGGAVCYEYIEVAKQGPITIVTIDRAHVMNALHPPACAEMCDALDAFEDDPKSWAVIITGSGDRAFCTGDDLRWTARHGREAQVEAFRDLLPRGGFGGMTHRTTRKPHIAAINGTAVGGGLEIALNCDMIVAAEHAKLGLVEGKVGFIAAGGGVPRLVRKIPHNIAMGMILTGETVDAAEASRWGLVNKVVPKGEALSEALRLAQAIVSTAPLSHRAAKELARLAMSEPTETLLPDPAAEDAWQRFPATMAVLSSNDAKEGPEAFVQKRAPVWTGS